MLARPSGCGQERTLGQTRFYGLKTEDDMVYLALTSQGLRDILDASEAATMPIWCSADALSEAEFEKLERGNITRFTYSFADADMATIQDALATIEEHHPGERVWIESCVFGV
jgi:hypothetical protein